MYTREIQKSRPAPVENRAPLQGTWITAFDEADLLSIHRPYSIPLPRWMKDFRVKEWETFTIQNGRFILQARFCNLKFYRYASVSMYDRETKKRLEYKKAIPGGGWHLPRNLYNASVDSRSWGFFFRIHSWLDSGVIQIELDIKESRKKPAFTALAAFDLSSEKTTPMAVSLLFSERRNMCAYKVLTPVRGDAAAGGEHIHFDPGAASGLFCDYKGYYPYRMRSAWAAGLGFDGGNRRFGFSLGENQAREPFKNNENALWIDGCLTPLPPVRITQSGGPDAAWIIQDMEGMVDLVFTPHDRKRSAGGFIFSREDYENPFGSFDGAVVSAEGEKLPVRNVFGTVEKLYLRV